MGNNKFEMVCGECRKKISDYTKTGVEIKMQHHYHQKHPGKYVEIQNNREEAKTMKAIRQEAIKAWNPTRHQ